MSRPLRVEIPDGWYHVMNRGLRRHTTFADDADHATFLETLAEACQMFGVRVGAYCLMPNHYHLLVKTPNANLSRFMRHVNGVYTQRFNRKNGKDGPLFRGRYRAVIVDADSYLLQVVRYIHLNPVQARLTEKPGKYPWSSDHFYRKSSRCPGWLNVKEVLTWFSRQPARARKRYQQFMQEGQNPDLKRFYAGKKMGWILGTEEFVEEVKNRIAGGRVDPSEIPQSRTLRGKAQLEKLVRKVRLEFKVPKATLFASKPGKLNLPRKVAIYLAWQVTGLSQREIADYFKLNSYRTVSVHHYNIKKSLQKDSRLKRRIHSIESTIMQ